MQQRKLAAIMFSDIVGYTSLMGESEKKAFEVINTNREIHNRYTQKHHGKIVKELGDGLLTVFENGTEAVLCAIDIQKEASERKIPLRIGIHEGEVVFDNNDVFGDGVNIASRIQAEAATGGVCITDTVQRIIKNKEDLKTGSLGRKSLKNVKDKIHLFQLISKDLAKRSHKSKRNRIGLITIVTFILGIGIGILLRTLFSSQSENDKANRYMINFPEESAASFQGGLNNIAISPDGTAIVYIGRKNNTTILYKRNLAFYEISTIDGTEGVKSLFFSPDGKWVGFFSDDQLHKVSINGGKIYDLGSLSELRYASWLPNDSIVLGGISGEGLKIISASGGVPKNLTKIDYDKLEWYHNQPTHIPGTDKILYSIQAVSGDISINLLDYKNGEEKVLIKNASNPKYIPTGYILYESEGSLYVNVYDMKDEIIMEPSYLLIERRTSDFDEGIQYSVSNDGIFIYFYEPPARIGELVWVDMKGNIKPIIEGYDSYIGPKISPDGNYIAFWRSHFRDDQVWIYDLDRESLFRFTTEGQNFWPIWYPDGKSLYFPSLGEGRTNLNIYMKSIGKTDPSTQLINSNVTQQPKAWSSDGNHLLYHQREESEKGYGIYLYNKTNGKTELFLDDNCDEGKPDFSPDNKWVVYESNKSGQYEVYVTDFPGKTKNYQISVMGGYEPLWSFKGDRIFYRKDGDFFVVNIELSSDIIFSKPQKLFSGSFLYIQAWGRYYDLFPDEQHFVMVTDSRNYSGTCSINVITNFFDEVNRKAGGR